MEEKIRIVVADDTEETRELVGRYLEFDERFQLVGTAKNGKEVIEQVAELKPDVVLMDINMPEMNGLEATEYISNHHPLVIVIIMSVQSEMDYIKKAMVSGAKEYIVKPFGIDDLNHTILTTYEKVSERTSHLFLESPVKTELKSNVIAFFSSKGGVGKSVLSTNVAYALSKVTKEKVALLDFDLQFGDLGMINNVMPKATITELADDHMTEDPDGIKNYMLPLTNNLDVLLAPRKPEFAEYISEKHIKDIITTLRKTYEYIIIDTATNFEDTTISVLDAADRIYFITTMDLLSIKNTKLGLDVMKSLKYSKDKVRVLVNRNVRTDISLADVEKTLDYKVDATFPEEAKALLKSVNHGTPIMVDNRSRGLKFGKSVVKFAKDISKEA